MKLYYFANVKSPAQLLAYQEAVSMMKKADLQVFSNVASASDFELSEQDNLVQIDAVILDSSSSEAEVGYLLAVAISHKKPVLYLKPKGMLLDDSIKALIKNKEIRKFLKIEFFSQENYQRKIKDFLQYLDQDIGLESYSIKFTLRLSPRLERYLEWRAEKSGKNKADFVRGQLEALMKADEEFRGRIS